MKILFIDTVHSILETRLIKMGFQCDMGIDLNRQEILSKIGDYQGLVLRSKTPIDFEFLQAAKQLKFIARSGAGIENIDLLEAGKRKIQLFSAPEGNRQALGEHALAMILSLFNKISIADKEIREGKWNRESNRGIELSGKTVGIIGYGNMGKAFAKCLSGFDCRVLAYDKHKKNISDDYVSESSLESIQKNAVIISFHTPYNKSTHNYLNEEFIQNMRKEFYLINTSRGKVVKTEALSKGLKTGKILGACLDVLEFEKTSFEDMFDQEVPTKLKELLEFKNILLSPHVGGWTIESYEKLSLVLAKKIEHRFGS